jgi:hypothetical protein
MKLLAVLSLAAMIGCSSNSADSTNVQPTEDAAAAVPCGTNVGDVLCDLALDGYYPTENNGALANASPYEAATLTEALARGTQPYAMVWTSSYW